MIRHTVLSPNLHFSLLFVALKFCFETCVAMKFVGDDDDDDDFQSDDLPGIYDGKT